MKSPVSVAAYLVYTLILFGLTNEAVKAQDVSDELLPTGRMLAPAGESISFHGRPVDLAVHNDFLFVKDRSALHVANIEPFAIAQTIASPGGASLTGLAVSPEGTVYFTNSKNGLHRFVAKDGDQGPYTFLDTIELPADSFPCGIALSGDEKLVYVCLSKKNSIGIVDLIEKKVVAEIPVGVAPFEVTLLDARTLLVSNIGGRRANDDDETATSADTPTVVDKRGIASTGTLSLIDLEQRKVTKTIPVGLHPSNLRRVSETEAIVANTNEDSISFVNAMTAETESVSTKPDPQLPFGSMPSDVLVDEPNQRLFVTLAGNNAIAILDLKSKAIIGLVPSGWYPASLAANDNYVFVANIKGVGSRSIRRDAAEGRNSHDHLGTVQRIPLASINNPKQLAQWTEQSRKLSRIPQILRANEAAENHPDTESVPIPERLGEPSVFKHVIYVIKENRTFDQVFGDIEEARSEPKLCMFPESVTPNHHALAKRFGILDNYYCNGVLSADGHSWATEGNVTPYLERAFGGFSRSYTFGDDPITYSSSGFLWDRFLDAGLSFRNYGEMNYSQPPNGMKYQDIWQAYTNKQPVKFTHKIGIERVRKYSCPDYPGWNMQIPDVLRMDRFLKEFREFEKNDGLPSLSLLYLPQDHLGGGITGRSHMADNDLALGRLVEAVSHSKYWKDTVIFVNEDDPQNGFDHIDGHRSLCLVISPYSKKGVNHQFFNQTSVLRTMLHVFGLPPLNQQDSSAPLMTDCFQPVADLEPYDAIANTIPLNEAPEPKSAQSTLEQEWRAILATVPIERTGMKSTKDEDNLNRFIWHENRGWTTPYPIEMSGPHATGLKQLGLVLDPHSDED